MKLLCPKCSTECQVSAPSVETATCPECGLLLFMSSESAVAAPMHEAGVASGPMQQTVSYQAAVAETPTEFFAVPHKVGRYRIQEFLGAGGYAAFISRKTTN